MPFFSRTIFPLMGVFVTKISCVSSLIPSPRTVAGIQTSNSSKLRSSAVNPFFVIFIRFLPHFVVVMGIRKGQQTVPLSHIPIQCFHSPGTLMVTS